MTPDLILTIWAAVMGAALALHFAAPRLRPLTSGVLLVGTGGLAGLWLATRLAQGEEDDTLGIPHDDDLPDAREDFDALRDALDDDDPRVTDADRARAERAADHATRLDDASRDTLDELDRELEALLEDDL